MREDVRSKPAKTGLISLRCFPLFFSMSGTTFAPKTPVFINRDGKYACRHFLCDASFDDKKNPAHSLRDHESRGHKCTWGSCHMCLLYELSSIRHMVKNSIDNNGKIPEKCVEDMQLSLAALKKLTSRPARTVSSSSSSSSSSMTPATASSSSLASFSSNNAFSSSSSSTNSINSSYPEAESSLLSKIVTNLQTLFTIVTAGKKLRAALSTLLGDGIQKKWWAKEILKVDERTERRYRERSSSSPASGDGARAGDDESLLTESMQVGTKRKRLDDDVLALAKEFILSQPASSVHPVRTVKIDGKDAAIVELNASVDGVFSMYKKQCVVDAGNDVDSVNIDEAFSKLVEKKQALGRNSFHSLVKGMHQVRKRRLKEFQCDYCREGWLAQMALKRLRDEIHADCTTNTGKRSDCPMDSTCPVEQKAYEDEEKWPDLEERILMCERHIENLKVHTKRLDNQTAQWSKDTKEWVKTGEKRRVLLLDFSPIQRTWRRRLTQGEMRSTTECLCIVVYYGHAKAKNGVSMQRFDFIANEKHDKHFVRSALWEVMKEPILNASDLEVRVWTDGASSHFKSRFTISTICIDLLRRMNLDKLIHYNFFVSNHGKGECDRHFGVLKNTLKYAAISGEIITGDSAIVDFANARFDKDYAKAILLDVCTDEKFDVSDWKGRCKDLHEFSAWSVAHAKEPERQTFDFKSREMTRKGGVSTIIKHQLTISHKLSAVGEHFKPSEAPSSDRGDRES